MSFNRRLIAIASLFLILTACSSSSLNSLNATVTVPKDWGTSYTIGGAMIIRPNKNNDVDAALSKINLHDYFSNKSGPSKNYTLADYQHAVLAHITEKNIGPKLQVSHKKSTLAGFPAFEVSYNYHPKDEAQKSFAKKIAAQVGGYVYVLRFGGTESAFHQYMADFKSIRRSLKIQK